MKSFLLSGLAVITLLYACNKSDNITSPITKGETIKVGINLSGEITSGTQPLTNGRQLPEGIAAKDIYDSTVYAVDVRTPDGTPYAAGLFNKADSILVELTKGVTYKINVAAIKKGSSIGLYWSVIAGGLHGYYYYDKPINRPLKNAMEYKTSIYLDPFALTQDFLQSMSYLSVRAEYIAADKDVYYYPELDSYFGTTTYNASDSTSSLNIALKRISFGLKYNLIDIPEGYVIADYDSLMKTKNIFGFNTNIYTADKFRDSETTAPIHLTLYWVKNDGSSQFLAETSLTPKRNSLTTINVTFPQKNSIKAVISLKDTTFAGNSIIPF